MGHQVTKTQRRFALRSYFFLNSKPSVCCEHTSCTVRRCIGRQIQGKACNLSGVPTRFMDNIFIMVCMIFSLLHKASLNLVLISPGQITFTRMLSSPHSLAMTLVTEISAALL